MSFHELLATERQKKAALDIPVDAISDLDRDRESSPDIDFSEMDQLMERMRPSQSQASKPASQARVASKKPRSSVNGLPKSDLVSSAKPTPKPKVIWYKGLHRHSSL